MRLRNPISRGNGHACRFGIRTRLARAAGEDGRYKLATIRALPSTKKDTVVLQATDGKQAVCVLAPGEMSRPRLVPAEVLPRRKSSKGSSVELVGDKWRSSEGPSVPDEYGDQFCYPPIAEVLPKFSVRGKAPPVQLGIDLALLSKVAESLGTSKLTLFVPVPVKPGGDRTGDSFVKKPIAICPATDEGKVRGIGVVMPLQPVNGVPFYMKVRRLVAAAEARCKPKARTRAANRQPQPV
jgi:hypothetical protein